MKEDIRYDYVKDNQFSELKDQEILRERLALVRDAAEYAGQYYSQLWIRKNILKQTDDEIEALNSEIEQKRKRLNKMTKVDSNEKINAMIKDINDKNFVDAENKFQSVMNDKVADALAQAKERLSKTLFNDKGELEIEKAEQ